MESAWTPEPFPGKARICLSAPAFAASGPDGQMRGSGLDGFYHADLRILNRLVLTINGREPEPWDDELPAPSHARFFGGHRTPRDHINGPTVTVDRQRLLPECVEQITIRNSGRERHRLVVTVTAGTDFAEVHQVRSGQVPPEVPALFRSGEVLWRRGDGTSSRLRATPPPDRVTSTLRPQLTWEVTLDRGQSWGVDLAIKHEPPRPRHLLPVKPPPWQWPSVRCSDRRLADLLSHSLEDLSALLVAWAGTEDAFLAAGAPWYLTLFGRDALWAARMMLPLGTELAAGTLRTLARLQGRQYDTISEEAPGKIIHEFRHTATRPVRGLALPPRYYGTVDATPLFVSLLADAWRWGLDEMAVRELLPAAERALDWIRAQSMAHGDGFIRCPNPLVGLRNQGWKDSPDAVQFADGGIPQPPIALAEVQAYAYEAASQGAELLSAFHRPGAQDWQVWADQMRKRFRDAFWVQDIDGPYVAMAVDANGRPVDAVTSNMGHLPGTGILETDEIAHVAARLAAPDMNSGWGLRTLSAKSKGYNAFGYHEGSVWPHDTAIAIGGLAAAGFDAEAAALLSGLLDAAPRFGFRLPEQWSGEERRPGPLLSPAACRPQAWAAASAITLLQAVAGLYPDVPTGRIALRPIRPAPAGGLEVSGLKVGDHEVGISVDDDGHALLTRGPSYLTVSDGFPPAV